MFRRVPALLNVRVAGNRVIPALLDTISYLPDFFVIGFFWAWSIRIVVHFIPEGYDLVTLTFVENDAISYALHSFG
jgi:hypothetical protein